MSEKSEKNRHFITETLFDHLGIRLDLEEDRPLLAKRTPHQNIRVFENPRLGTVLMHDDTVQLTTADAFMYHEMMVHVPLFAHGNAKRVLIIGGGDCGIAREVLKHPGVEYVLQVEVDSVVVEIARKYLPEFTEPVFDDQRKRFGLLIGDGMDFVLKTKERFDVIIVDSTDPQGPGKVLFSYKFYEACKKALHLGGVMVTQNGVPFMQPGELVSSIGHFRKLFTSSGCYITSIPTYFGGHMAMGWASNSLVLPNHSVGLIDRRYREAGEFETNYWTPEVHKASFALPRFIQKLMQ